jgi:lambda family phage tail tape measure protein
MTPGNYTMAPGFSFGDSGNTAGGLVTGDGTFAKGGVFPGAALAHFENQIIDRPTMFRFAAGGAVGLMGEAGHEAIMPLRRGADGKLGVTQHGGGSAPNITFNITTPNAESFKASQSQLNSKAAAHLQTTSMRNATH